MTLPNDLSRDELRRRLADSREAHDEVAPLFRNLIARVFGDDRRRHIDSGTAIARLERRQIFKIGGFAVATSAVLAACGKGDGDEARIPRLGEVPVTTALATRCADDIVLLRTAVSLELAAIEAYTAAARLIGDLAIRSAAVMFSEHHREHAGLFDRAARDRGNLTNSVPNPVVMESVIKPALASVKDQDGAIAFAHELENVAAATYQAIVPSLTTPELRRAAMSIGGVEARHAAVLAGLIKGSQRVAGADKLPGVSTTAAPTTAAATAAATTAAGGAAGGAAAAEPVFQVPGAFGTVTKALGPNSFVYRSDQKC